MTEPSADPNVDSNVDGAYAFLRGHTTGDLRFDEHLRPIKYVIAPDGRMIAPAMVAMLGTLDTVMFVPEYAEETLELQVTLEEFDESEPGGGALTDRWRIHHGDPPDVHWAIVHIDAARFGEIVMDGDALTRPNPLADAESALCREMNTLHRDGLRDLCHVHAEINVETPVMVAIDPLGIDVRGRFDVIRVAMPEPMPDADAARAQLEALCRAAAER